MTDPTVQTISESIARCIRALDQTIQDRTGTPNSLALGDAPTLRAEWDRANERIGEIIALSLREHPPLLRIEPPIDDEDTRPIPVIDDGSSK